jgi:hypothetical protein
MSHRDRIAGLIAEITERKDLIVSTAALGAPASEAEIATARRYASHQLPPGVEEFYREMNGFHLEWEGEDGDRGVSATYSRSTFSSQRCVPLFEKIPTGSLHAT